MDAYEILSTIRNYSGLETENDIKTPLLRRYANIGMQYVGQLLLPLFHEFLVITKTYTDESGDSVDLPGDVLRILDVEREDSDDIMKLCTKVPVEDKGLIGKNANYPNEEDYPSFVHEGRELYVYPVLSTTDVNVRYRRRIADMCEGKATYVSATTATLGGNASPDDDAYNSYDFAIYTVTGTEITLQGIYKCTDYVGSSKTITLDGSNIFVDDGTVYYYAIVPIIPNEFHNFIVDGGIIELKKARKLEGDWVPDENALNARIANTLKVNGVTG